MKVKLRGETLEMRGEGAGDDKDNALDLSLRMATAVMGLQDADSLEGQL